MRFYGFLFLFAAVAVVGILLMYGKIGQWDRVRIEIGGESRENEASGPISLPIGRSRIVLATAEREVMLEIVRPEGPPAPVVFLVRGRSDESRIPYGAHEGELARTPFAVATVHDDEVPREERSTILLDAIAYLQRVTDVRGDRIGLLAFADAAPLAIVTASLSPEVAVLAVHNPTMPGGFDSDLAENLPRTLLIIDADDTAAVATKYSFERWFREYQTPYDIRDQAGGEASELQAWSDLYGFLREYLP